MKKLKKAKPEETDVAETDISRKEAIKKLGMIALSATTMMLLLNDPAKSQDDPDSPDNPPEWP